MSPVINPLVIDPSIPPVDGPCDWPLDVTCVPAWAETPPNVQVAATEWATFILWALTGRQYGGCQYTVRPCGPTCGMLQRYLTWPVNAASASGAGYPWMIPWIDNGLWRNCGCAGGCSCAPRCQVALPGSVATVDEVRVDGVVLDPSAYRLDSVGTQPMLVRIDGECWPECQDLDLPLTEPGTFAVTFTAGKAVPVAGQIAAGKLAGEFAKACVGAECALPQQLASLSRNGVEVTVVDPTLLLENGLTGIADVDLFIRSVNPTGRRTRTRVLSPDIRRPRFV